MATSPGDVESAINRATAAVLRAERAAAKMTVDDLARQSGIPKRTLLRLLKPERMINVEHLHKIGTALGIPLGDLLSAAEERARRNPDGDGDGDHVGDKP